MPRSARRTMLVTVAALAALATTGASATVGSTPGKTAGSTSGSPAGSPAGSSPGSEAGSTAGPRRPAAAPRSVMYVGNNWDGTADVIDPTTLSTLGRLDIVPDKAARLMEIYTSPDRLAFYLAIQQAVGEGHDQLVDDMFSTRDGSLLAVSRPSFADVVGIDLATRQIAWRFPMEGYRSDHMGVSPDGTRLLVSDATSRKVHELDLRTGTKTGEFESGDTPHESNYTTDGTKVFHASIGTVYTPLDQPVFDTTKGDRWFQVVDAGSKQVLKRWDIGQKLKEAGYPDMSSAVRPMAIAPDERFAYLQISFHHGLIEFDMQQERVTRVLHMPQSEEAASTPREQYLLDSAHHGLAMNGAGTRLCDAGTMSDYTAIIDRKRFSHTIAGHGTKPYWATNSPDGTACWVSYSGDDAVTVYDYATARQIGTVPVGDHPQRIRAGHLSAAAQATL